MGYGLLCAHSDASRAICPVVPFTAELYARNPHIVHHMSALLPKWHAVLSSRDVPSLVPLLFAFAFLCVPVDVTTMSQGVPQFPGLSPCTLVRFNTPLHANFAQPSGSTKEKPPPEAHSDHPLPLHPIVQRRRNRNSTQTAEVTGNVSFTCLEGTCSRVAVATTSRRRVRQQCLDAEVWGLRVMADCRAAAAVLGWASSHSRACYNCNATACGNVLGFVRELSKIGWNVCEPWA